MNDPSHDGMERVVQLADAYLQGELDAQGLDELQGLIQDDPARAELLLQFMLQAGARLARRLVRNTSVSR